MSDKLPVAFGENGVQLRSLEDAYRFASAVHSSGLVPTAYRSAEAVLVVMQTGMELGYTPMQAIRNMWPGPDGRPNEYVEASWARVLLSGLVEDWSEEVTDEEATFQVTRRGLKTPIVSTYTMADAKKAGLVKDGGNWAKHPKRMLKARAKGFAIKDGFADVLKGIGIAEVRDEFYGQPKDVTPPRPIRSDVKMMIDAADAVRNQRERITISEDVNSGSEPDVLIVYDIYGVEIYNGRSREEAEKVFCEHSKGLTKEEMAALCEVNPSFCELVEVVTDHVGSEFGLPDTEPSNKPVVNGGLLMPDGNFLLATSDNLTKWRDDWVSAVANEKDKTQRQKISDSFKLSQQRASSYFSNNPSVCKWIDQVSSLMVRQNDHTGS